MTFANPIRPVQPAKPAAAPAQPSRMTLGAVKRGRIARPKRIVVYGTEGIGKSTFAAAAPSPVFLATEDGTAHLDCARFPEPTTWQDVLDAVRVLEVEPHDFKTLAIDTLDWLEPLCWAHVCAKGGKKSIEDFGYGKGYEAALDEWRAFLARLDGMRLARGLDVILLAHSWIKTFANPEGDDFDRYELKLHKKASGLVKEWADAVLFARYETFAVGGDGKGGKAKGFGNGARVLHTERRPAFDAKNRFGLPETLPLSWESFSAAVEAGTPDDPAKLAAAIEAVASSADEATATKIREALGRAAGDGTKLAQLLDWARGKAATAAKESE